jgi:integrase/recombinase XerD
MSHNVEVFGADEVRMETAAWLMRYSSRRTREAYSRAHREFAEFCRRAELVSPQQVTRGHVDAWLRLLERRLAPSSVRAYVAAVSSWFGALVDAGVVDRNPCAGVRRPKVDNRMGSTPAAVDEQVRRMYEVAQEVGPDAHALVGLLVELGVRISEACTVPPENILVLPGGQVGVRFVRKGGVADTRRVSAGLGAVLLGLKRERSGDVGTLLRSNARVTMTRDGARNTLAGVARRAGVEHLHPHMVRVWAITTALGMPGVELHDVQDFAGHADPQMTRRYDRVRNRKDQVIASGLLGVLAERPEVETAEVE